MNINKGKWALSVQDVPYSDGKLLTDNNINICP